MANNPILIPMTVAADSEALSVSAAVAVVAGDAVLGTKNITANGVYSAASDGLDGYSSVDVSVSGGGATLGEKSISANGVYNASSDSLDGYSKVTVAVPASAVDTGTKNINTNGTHDVIGYASASVSVPNSYSAGDEGKVVSNGALVSQTSDTVTTNDTYDTTLINSLTVNVSGGGGSANAATGTITLASDVSLPTNGGVNIPGLALNFVPDFFWLMPERSSFESIVTPGGGLWGVMAYKRTWFPPIAISGTTTPETEVSDYTWFVQNPVVANASISNGYGLNGTGSALNASFYSRYAVNSDGTITVGRYSTASTKMFAGTYRYFAYKLS